MFPITISSVTKCGGPTGISSTSSLPRPPLASKLLTFSHPSGCCESRRRPVLPKKVFNSYEDSLVSYKNNIRFIVIIDRFKNQIINLLTTCTEQVLTASPSLFVALHIYVPLSSEYA